MFKDTKYKSGGFKPLQKKQKRWKGAPPAGIPLNGSEANASAWQMLFGITVVESDYSLVKADRIYELNISRIKTISTLTR